MARKKTAKKEEPAGRREQLLFEGGGTIRMVTRQLDDGRRFGAAHCVVKLFGGQVAGIAVVLDIERHVNSRDAMVEWLEARGIPNAEAQLSEALNLTESQVAEKAKVTPTDTDATMGATEKSIREAGQNTAAANGHIYSVEGVHASCRNSGGWRKLTSMQVIGCKTEDGEPYVQLSMKAKIPPMTLTFRDPDEVRRLCNDLMSMADWVEKENGAD